MRRWGLALMELLWDTLPMRMEHPISGRWFSDGVELRLAGTANDYVGKGQGGGLVVVKPRRPNDSVPHAAGNAVLF